MREKGNDFMCVYTNQICNYATCTPENGVLSYSHTHILPYTDTLIHTYAGDNDSRLKEDDMMIIILPNG